MTINIVLHDAQSIERRIMEARQTRTTIEWLGHQILMSDLPEDQNDNEELVGRAWCCHCQEQVWIFPTMLTSCQICGHDWSSGLWEFSVAPERQPYRVF